MAGSDCRFFVEINNLNLKSFLLEYVYVIHRVKEFFNNTSNLVIFSQLVFFSVTNFVKYALSIFFLTKNKLIMLLMNTFIQQGHTKLIINDSDDF